MNVWMVRGGKSGEQEALALEKGMACIGFYELPDLSRADTPEAMRELVVETYPDATDAKVSNFQGQVYSFAHRMKEGDIVAMPVRSQPTVALGRVSGPYKFREDLGETHHTRKVDWVCPDVPRSQFKQDLLYSLGAFMTVCQIQRNGAVERFKTVLEGQPDPGLVLDDHEDGGEAEFFEVLTNVEQVARDQIRAHMETNFRGHELSRLVDAVLGAEGYVTRLSPPGPDGGVDILARRGSLGLDGPRLCVQVKSSSSPADVTIFRGLQGTMATFKAEEGLLVSWGGFNRAVLKEARLSFFSVRLWDADDLLAAVQRNYDGLPEEVQNELPLKRIWALVAEE